MHIEKDDRFNVSAKADSQRRTELGHAADSNALEIQGKPGARIGQMNPQACPRPKQSSAGELGPPMSIKEVAAMIGCSVWTVRQRLIPETGLPHVRLAPRGRIIFYRYQVEEWLRFRQKIQGGEAA
jgi:excisionase family DNA binding protein